ncbi:MAG: tetratricopeptide repeat protein, partial [Planctomycetaceae bacterium]|nr:tetratricopeptide repeat protein [Planctomycetaceae bacterium]
MADSDPLSGAAQEWFRKGTEAMNRQNWDFAVESFNNAIKMKPDVLLFRQTKLLCCRKMYNDNGTGARMAGMKLMGVRSKIKKARSKEEWAAMDEQAEEGLGINPWDAQLLADVGEACAALDRGEIAIFALTKAVELAGDNIDFLRRLGRVAHERGEYNLARNCFKKIYALDPTDSDARSMMGRIDADAVMDRGNYDKAGSTQDVKVEKEPTNAYEEDRRARRGRGPADSVAPGESVEMDLRQAIRKDPKNIALYTKLADHLRAERKLPQAVEQLDLALSMAPNETGVLEMKEDIEIEMIKDRLAEAVERARKNPDKAHLKEKADALKEELLNLEVAALASRTERNPNDMKIRY